MAKYLFIESRDPFTSTDVEPFADIVRGVKERGNEATVFLVQNGVLQARRGAAKSAILGRLLEAGVTVLADGHSLAERAIAETIDGVTSTDFAHLTELLMEEGTKAVWH